MNQQETNQTPKPSEVVDLRPSGSYDPDNLYSPAPDSTTAQFHRMSRGDELNERNLSDLARHIHDGANSRRIQVQFLLGSIPRVSAAPTYSPKTFLDHFRLYSNGGTYRLYIYDAPSQAWRYAALT